LWVCGQRGALSKQLWSLWVTLPMGGYPQAPQLRHIHCPWERPVEQKIKKSFTVTGILASPVAIDNFRLVYFQRLA
jgi:hypothetical protein